MAVTAASTFTTNALNYQGVLLQLAPRKTPLTTMLMADGKLSADGSKVINMSKTWAPDAFSQPSISESGALTAPAETSYLNTPATNVKQIFQKAIEVSYDKQADTIMTATAVNDMPFENDDMDAQIAKHMAVIKGEIEYSCLNGVYAADGGNPATARAMRGIVTASTTNTVAAGGVDLSKDLIRELLVEMAGNEAAFDRMQIHANAFQIDVLDQLYGAAPTDRFIGGTQTLRIMTPFAGEIELIYNPVMSADELLIVDYAWLSLKYTPYKGQFILVEELSKLGAGDRDQIVACCGIDYTHAVLHGTLTGLATS